MTSIQRSIGGLLAIVALVVTAVVYDVRVVRGSDHQDSPTVLARPAADITDVYVYPDPNDATRVVFQMDVDPLLTPGAATTGAALDPAVLYQFKIAHGAQAGQAEDTVIQVLASGAGPTQTISLYGPVAPTLKGTNSAPTGTPITFAFNSAATLSNGVQAFVGPRADPFFFDLGQFFKIIPDRNYANQPNPPAATASGFRGFTAAFNTTNSTACDTTPAVDTVSSNSFNVLAIVVEMPKAMLTAGGQSSLINVWATTSTQAGS
jgi:hypothetical protein